MKIGFTGTRDGMTPQQVAAVEVELADEFGMHAEFHHGDCVGADTQAADIAWDIGFIVIVHPPIDPAHRAYNDKALESRPEKSHFARNRDIVDETDCLIACPPYMDDITKDTRGGTAYTVNYARKRGKPIFIVRPNGSVVREPAPADAGEGGSR